MKEKYAMRKIFQTGDSLVVSLPREWLKELNLEKGSWVRIHLYPILSLGDKIIKGIIAIENEKNKEEK